MSGGRLKGLVSGPPKVDDVAMVASPMRCSASAPALSVPRPDQTVTLAEIVA